MADRRGGKGLARPSAQAGRKRKPRSFTLPDDLIAALDEESRERCVSMSSLVEEALRERYGLHEDRSGGD